MDRIALALIIVGAPFERDDQTHFASVTHIFQAFVQALAHIEIRIVALQAA